MSLEATMIFMDNSEYARNGDLYPSRWVSQMEAIQLIANAKLENMESGVGLILAAGKQVQLLMTPTNDQNQLISTCEDQRLKGQLRFSVALYIAQLTLKHRVNKKQAQRIVAFVASPVEEDEATLISIAKKLKKNNIAVDVINFGEQREDHLQKLENFVDAVKKGNNSMFLNIKPGSSVMDLLFTALSNNAQQFQSFQEPAQSQIVQQEQPQVQQRGRFDEYGGIDPSIDPELAMAIKMSLEEEAARQHQSTQQLQQPQNPQLSDVMQMEQERTKEKSSIQQQKDDIEEDELMRRARELSLQEEERDQQYKQGINRNKQQENKLDKDFIESLLKDEGVNVENEEVQQLLKKEEERSEQNKKK